ncbi:MAG: hypothetical protein HC808_14435 [Candidatus Competibacteraceae bacterium]|nr:hypothetical protein [Candidatus Competibacteraceae bacterium]
MEFVATSDIVAKGLVTLLTIILLLLGYRLVTVALMSILGNLVNFALQYLALRRGNIFACKDLIGRLPDGY